MNGFVGGGEVLGGGGVSFWTFFVKEEAEGCRMWWRWWKMNGRVDLNIPLLNEKRVLERGSWWFELRRTHMYSR